MYTSVFPAWIWALHAHLLPAKAENGDGCYGTEVTDDWSHNVDMGIKHGSSVRAANAINHSVISAAPTLPPIFYILCTLCLASPYLFTVLTNKISEFSLTANKRTLNKL